MIIKPKRHSKIEINLDGSQGNAYYIMGIANELCKQCGIDFEQFKKEAFSSDYITLIKTFDSYFGTIVTIMTSNADLLK
jgi:hypothetical protein